MAFLHVIHMSSETEFFWGVYISVELTLQIIMNEYSQSEEKTLQLIKAV